MPLAGTYRPRHPEHTAFYQCLEDCWEEFQEAYPYFYEREYGPWRPVVEKTVERFLQGGILRHGFSRLRCGHHLPISVDWKLADVLGRRWEARSLSQFSPHNVLISSA